MPSAAEGPPRAGPTTTTPRRAGLYWRATGKEAAKPRGRGGSTGGTTGPATGPGWLVPVAGIAAGKLAKLPVANDLVTSHLVGQLAKLLDQSLGV